MSEPPAAGRLVVVGGGPSGLAAAWKASVEAERVVASLEIVVLEADDQVGGKARTEHAADLLIETGPQGFLDDQPVLREMIDACGLEDEVLAPEPAANRRYIYRGGRLRELSRSPLAFASSGLLGPLGLARLAMEPLVPARRPGADRTEGADSMSSGAAAGEDESLFDFAARRMGRQAARRLISPVVLGIFAGDARKLSAAAAFPRLVAMEEAYGSLFKAMRAGRRRGAPPPGHRTLLEGIQSLPRAVASLPGIEVRCNQRVTAVERRGSGFTVTSSAGDVGADAVVAAADLPAAADLVDGVSAAAADELRQIESPPMAVVHTAFEAGAAAHVEPAYGFLVARGEGIRMLGCQYETATFRGRSPDGTFLTRSLFGGSVDPEAASLGDAELVDLTLRELRRTAGIDADPTWTSVARWPHAIPQYAPGHPQRVARIEAALDPIAGFHLAGNVLHGVGLSRAIAVGADCGERAARQLLH
ncbi:MAG: protoporphyrinogen oxidase [Holophagales bacterium]|nr:protoporphyrinogen oxidase [Holophagales bacterium]MYF94683.1 protoporphyrinogen oxidase [Holophagales bacterium]